MPISFASSATRARTGFVSSPGRYDRRAYLGAQETKPVRARVAALAKEHAIRDRRRVKLAPPAPPEQLSLLTG